MATQTINSSIEHSFNSFSGCDMKAIFNNKVIAECQAVTYSIRREKSPIYTLGSPDPRGYARGKRGIAGSAVFVMFDRNAFLEELMNTSTTNIATTRDIPGTNFTEQYSNQGIVVPVDNMENQIFGVNEVDAIGTSILSSTGSSFNSPADIVGALYRTRTAWYCDQLPPYHITMAMANEAGHAASMRILFVETLNEGMGISVDDPQMELATTFVARRVIPLKAITINSYAKG